MLTISGDKVQRDGQTVGYVEGTYVKDRDYKTLGYFDDTYVYDASGKKRSYLEGDYLYSYASRSSYTELSQVNKAVKGGSLSPAARAAVYELIGA